MDNHIMLIEDDHDLGSVLKQYLESSGYKVSWLSDPLLLANDLMMLTNVQLAIIDVMMPGMSGFELSKLISQHTHLPFLFLTAKSQSIDRILGLKLGADDYISKPCEPEELLLRVKNILKRSEKIGGVEVVAIGHYHFIPAKYQLQFGEKTYDITEKETELLLLLLRYNQQVISRKEILEKLWGENDYFLGRSLDVFMSRLRKYFAADSRIRFDSVRGVGFKIFFPLAGTSATEDYQGCLA